MSESDFWGILLYLASWTWPLFLVGFLWWLARRGRVAQEEGEDLDAIAAAVRGEVARDPAFDGPFVRFTADGGARCYLYQWLLQPGTPHLATTLECRIGFRGFIEATSTGSIRYPSRSPRFRMLQREADYQIVTTDPEWADQTLQRGLGQILREVRQWTGRPARIQLAADRFVVEIEDRITAKNAGMLVQFMNRIAGMGGGAEFSAGVTFLGEVAVSDHARCPVCAQRCAPPRLACRQCQAPHHPDCWAYWGRCAIFGCRGRQAA